MERIILRILGYILTIFGFLLFVFQISIWLSSVPAPESHNPFVHFFYILKISGFGIIGMFMVKTGDAFLKKTGHNE